MFLKIIVIRKDDKVTIPKERGTVQSYNGQMQIIITTKGWDIQVKWEDKSTSWIFMSIIKESNAVTLS